MSSNLNFLDRYIAGDSIVHRADARMKLVVTLSFILATTSLAPGAWPAFGAMVLLVWSMVLLSGAGPGRIFRRSLLVIPFVLVAAPTVFTKPGAALFEMNLGLGHLTATDKGLEFFISVLVKSWASVTAAALFTATTPFLQVLDGLQFLRLPKTLVAIVAFMYRYVFVVVDEAQRLLRARRARSAAIGPKPGGAIRWRARAAGGMVGSLFVRTYDRSERIYLAMLARGYDGHVRQIRVNPLRKWAAFQGLGAMSVFAVIASLSRVFW